MASGCADEVRRFCNDVHLDYPEKSPALSNGLVDKNGLPVEVGVESVRDPDNLPDRLGSFDRGKHQVGDVGA